MGSAFVCTFADVGILVWTLVLGMCHLYMTWIPRRTFTGRQAYEHAGQHGTQDGWGSLDGSGIQRTLEDGGGSGRHFLRGAKRLSAFQQAEPDRGRAAELLPRAAEWCGLHHSVCLLSSSCAISDRPCLFCAACMPRAACTLPAYHAWQQEAAGVGMVSRARLAHACHA